MIEANIPASQTKAWNDFMLMVVKMSERKRGNRGWKVSRLTAVTLPAPESEV